MKHISPTRDAELAEWQRRAAAALVSVAYLRLGPMGYCSQDISEIVSEAKRLAADWHRVKPVRNKL